MMAEISNLLEQEIMKYAKNSELPCVTAFEIADKLNVPAQDIGEAADGLEIRLVKCQLGLFGYKPDKKTVKPLETVSSELKSAINNSLESGKLSCVKAWEIASQLKIQRFSISCACETMEVKIKECQLGAF